MRGHIPRAAGWTPARASFAALGKPRIGSGRLLALVLVLPLLLGVTGPSAVRGDDLSDAIAQQKALAAKVKDQRAEVTRLRSMQSSLASDISATLASLNEINANLNTTQARITHLSSEIASVKATYDDLVAQVALLDRQVAAAEDQQAAREKELEGRKALLAAHVREAYRTDRTPLMQAVLSANTFTDLVSDVGSYIDFGAQDHALADQIEADIRTIETYRSLLVETRAAREELRTETLAQKKQLDARMVDLRTAKARLADLQDETARELAIQRAGYAKLAKNKAALAAAITRDVAAQKKLESKVEALVARQRDLGNIPSQYNGTLAWPLVGSVTQEFGCTGFASEPQVGNCAHFHQGIDIVAPSGTPVRAAGDGRVIYAGWNYADGADPAWIVVVVHADNLRTWYAHLQPIRPAGAAVGDVVAKGQIIGYEGNTGNSTGAHLHWMVWLNGNFVNPRLFVPSGG